jgi:hypothetical protein
MAVSPPVRKTVLLVHVVTSVGWLGAVIAFLVLAITVATNANDEMIRAAFPSLRVIVWFAIVPLSIASLVTGVLCSLASNWGIIRYYWVAIKLIINAAATTLLLLYTQSIDRAATLSLRPEWDAAQRVELTGYTHVLHSSAALLVIITATALSVFKPKGLTGLGRRRPTV